MDGKRELFEQIYMAYEPEIRRFIYVEARRDAEITADIAQNTWENAFRYLHTLQDKDAVRAWLYTIARNEAKRYFARHGVRFYDQALSLHDADGMAFDPQDEAETLFPETLADTEFLVKLMNRLPKDEQQLIMLHYYYGLSLRDIADLYGANYNTLKSITRRAIAKLRAAAKSEGS
jgi:RNA polymerase sigma-70 factor (ECF subfamily)